MSDFSGPLCRKKLRLDQLTCRFFMKGFCRDKYTCLFPHVYAENRQIESICRYHLKDNCYFGNYCKLDHVELCLENGEPVIEYHNNNQEDDFYYAGNCLSAEMTLDNARLNRSHLVPFPSFVTRLCIKMNEIKCRYYARGMTCPDGDYCPFPHINSKYRVPDKACRHHLKQRCLFGDDCYFDHVVLVEIYGEEYVEFLPSQFYMKYGPIQDL